MDDNGSYPLFFVSGEQPSDLKTWFELLQPYTGGRREDQNPIVIGKTELTIVSVAVGIELGIVPDRPDDKPLRLWQSAIKRRHGKLWNNEFCDGHVQVLKRSGLFDSRQDEVRKRWNNDNAPHQECVLRYSTVYE